MGGPPGGPTRGGGTAGSRPAGRCAGCPVLSGASILRAPGGDAWRGEGGGDISGKGAMSRSGRLPRQRPETALRRPEPNLFHQLSSLIRTRTPVFWTPESWGREMMGLFRKHKVSAPVCHSFTQWSSLTLPNVVQDAGTVEVPNANDVSRSRACRPRPWFGRCSAIALRPPERVWGGQGPDAEGAAGWATAAVSGDLPPICCQPQPSLSPLHPHHTLLPLPGCEGFSRAMPRPPPTPGTLP